MFDIGLFGAFVAGLLSFLSPCVLPLVPPYLCFLAGSSLDQLIVDHEESAQIKRQAIINAILFVIGFNIIFISLGATATFFGQMVAENMHILSKIAGGLIIIMGLHFSGVIRIPFLYMEKRYHHKEAPLGYLGAVMVGMAFAFGWTPCVGPVLATILMIAAGGDTPTDGMTLLAAYGIGIGIPFILAAFAIGPFLRWSAKFRSNLGRVEKVMGGFLILTGIMIMFGWMNDFGYFIQQFWPQSGEIG